MSIFVVSMFVITCDSNVKSISEQTTTNFHQESEDSICDFLIQGVNKNSVDTLEFKMEYGKVKLTISPSVSSIDSVVNYFRRMGLKKLTIFYELTINKQGLIKKNKLTTTSISEKSKSCFLDYFEFQLLNKEEWLKFKNIPDSSPLIVPIKIHVPILEP